MGRTLIDTIHGVYEAQQRILYMYGKDDDGIVAYANLPIKWGIAFDNLCAAEENLYKEAGRIGRALDIAPINSV